MKTCAFRISPGLDLRKELSAHFLKSGFESAFIITGLGSLSKATLRLADEQVKEFSGSFEIVSMEGTFSSKGNHIHIAIADASGYVLGGHLKEGCIVHTTVEMVLGEAESVSFTREFDSQTGFKELKIIQK